MEKYFILIIVSLLLTISGCRNGSDSMVGDKPWGNKKLVLHGSPNLIDEYTDFFTGINYSKISLNISSTTPVQDLDNSRSDYSIICRDFNNPYNSDDGFMNNGSLMINDVLIPFKNQTNSYELNTPSVVRQFFGNKVKPIFNNPIDTLLTDSLYIPKEIFLSVDPKILNTDTSYSYNTSDNISLKWNADFNNAKGVVISIEYDDAMTKLTGSSSTQTPSNDELDLIFTEDIGNFIIPSSYLSNLPTNCIAKINIVRCNFGFIGSISPNFYKGRYLLQSSGGAFIKFTN
ncbi:MAG: hypothetical protein K1X81_06195 [Bacteroidia bacterium]|nr:hypothetical protein [Bacteroidia bacterium]